MTDDFSFHLHQIGSRLHASRGFVSGSKATGRNAAQIKATWAKLLFTGKGNPPKEVSGNAEVKKFVAGNPAAIGYIDKAAVDGSVKVVLSLP